MSGARSPEELQTLLEDGLLMQDGPAVATLFEDEGVVVLPSGEVRDRRLATQVLAADDYAEPLWSGVVRDVGTVLTTRAVSVCRRGDDRCWRLVAAIVLGDAAHA